jgi:hypothetical protein
MPVILRCAQDLAAALGCHPERSEGMTARTPLTSSHGTSSLQTSGGGGRCTIDFFCCAGIVLSVFFGYAYTGGSCCTGCQRAGICVDKGFSKWCIR